MQDFIIKLLESYQSKEPIEMNPINDKKSMDFLEYHKLDMIYYDFLAKNNLLIPTNLEEKKKKIESINNGYFKIAKKLSIELKKNNIEYVFLKGLPCSIDLYFQSWHRYFNDIDLLIEKSEVKKVEQILLEMGYVFGDKSKDGNYICQASRNDILFQKTFTHELYNMSRLEEDGWISNVDANFLFSWIGIGESNNISVSCFLENIINKNGINIFDDVINMLHLCSHLYNEAVYFALNKNFKGQNPKEIQLNRIFDIALLAKRLNKKDYTKLFKLSKTFGFEEKVHYAITLVNQILKLNIETNPEFNVKYYEQININQYISKEKKIENWPISVYERVFNLEKKEKISKILFSNYKN